MTESPFTVNFSEDKHTLPINPPTGSEEEQSDDDVLVLILLASLVGIAVILPRLSDSTDNK